MHFLAFSQKSVLKLFPPASPGNLMPLSFTLKCTASSFFTSYRFYSTDTKQSLSNSCTAENLPEELDPLKTIQKASQNSMEEVRAIQAEEKRLRVEEKSGDPIKSVEASRKRRNLRRRRTVDNILGDVLHDALRLRDLGQKPDVDFIYKRTQERLYEEEYGKKLPSSKENAGKYVPFPPDFHLHRILPLYNDTDPITNSNTEKMRWSYTFELLQDPWYQRSISPSNPVWTKKQVEEDASQNGGKKLKEWERSMFAPRPSFDLVGELLDAGDELAHWEYQLINFLRKVPLTQRRTLPYLHEWYRIIVHRTIRAERRYTVTRDEALASVKASSALFKDSELVIERIRGIYAESHKSLSSVNYDPLRMKKSILARFMRMSENELNQWKEEEKQKRNRIIAKLSN